MAVNEGDPFGDIKQDKKPESPEPREVNLFHTRSDVDTSTTAQHHTLGVKHDQGSPGDHSHDGKVSRKIGTGLALTVSGSKGANAALTSLLTMLKNVIEFTDSTT
jgi:hypothetical protein